MQDAHVLQVLVLIGLAVIGFSWLGRRLGVAPPIVLLLGGVPLAFIPWLEHVRLPPEVVLLIFLPALLYWESINTSLREIRANLRAVMLAAVGLTLVTAAVVAMVGHALGLSWPVAWVLGAVVAPTDATAVSAIGGRLPRRQVTTLRAESLINDGTALVVFAIAVEVAAGERHFSWGSAVGSFGLSYVGGAAAGLLTAWLATRVRKMMHDPILDNGLSLVTPFAAFLLAEEIHASGVLAVVVCGLVLSQVGPRIIAAGTRLQAFAFARVAAFVLNGTLFVLVGLQLRSAVEGLVSYSLTEAIRDALLVAGAVIVTRLAWVYTAPYIVRALDRRPQQRLRRVGARHRFPHAWAGFRGGVSLAAALAVPVTLADGSPFPGRDLIILVTFGVILVTLLVQGLTLPAVLRWARLPNDDAEVVEQQLAQRAAAEAGLAALPDAVERLGIGEQAADRVRADYEEHLHTLDDSVDENGSGHLDDYRRLMAALIPEKRAAVVGLRDANEIDDIVLRRVQARLDAEEVRLAAPSMDDEE